jgi:hypothetical protein
VDFPCMSCLAVTHGADMGSLLYPVRSMPLLALIAELTYNPEAA